jgi:hypothetical protein
MVCFDDMGSKCDGSGHCVACLSASDCGSQSACQTPTCSGGSCGANDAPPGTTCTDHDGTRCNGNGTCVACLSASDCPAPMECVSGVCSGP